MSAIDVLRNFYIKVKTNKNKKVAIKNIKKDKEFLRLLKSNERFKGVHKGQRCFIIGNGPSLNTEDLSPLENEIVFTVNKIANHPSFEKMKTNYHFWADPAFCSLSKEKEEDVALVERMIAVNTEGNSPICFFPHFARKMVEEFELDKTLNINFYHGTFRFYDGENADIDFSKPTFGFQCVVQFAIAMAIYMGFSEIYLLGCDSTAIISAVQACLGENVTEYSYNVDENEKKFLKNMVTNRAIGIESEFLSWARILHLYKELYRYCNERNIKLVNCSSKTIVDSIPREKLENVLKNA